MTMTSTGASERRPGAGGRGQAAPWWCAVALLCACGTTTTTPGVAFQVDGSGQSGDSGALQDAGGGVDAGDVSAGTDGAAAEVADTSAETTGSDVADAAPPADTAPDVGKDVEAPKSCTFEAALGPSGKECPDDQLCVGDVGACKGTVQGVCKPVITTCQGATGSPVCDCKGKTWSNACEAQKNAQTIASDGACVVTGPQPCGGNTGGICPLGQVCDPATCTQGAAGVCVPDPTGGPCPDGGKPECGCNEKTYPNTCYRLLASVAKKAEGACPPNAGAELCKIGPAGKQIGTCPAGAWCQVYDTNPIPCTGEGECVPVPPVCDNSVLPVCGCDFQSYGNACKAGLAKANVKDTGACGGGGCTEGQNTCGAGSYCAVPKGQCGGQGVCIQTADPQSCTGVIDPVCGCDNKTYANPGCAAVAGVVVKSNGACN